MLKSRPLYHIDGYDPSISELQKILLLGRLNKDNISNFDNNPDNVFNNNFNIEKLYNLALNLPDAKRVIDLFKNDITKDSHICLISDFDTDGITSCVVLEKSLEALGYTNVSTIVNKRKYGTGVTNYCLDNLERINNEKKVDLIILSDHGSSNGPEYNKIQNNIVPKVKILLTDHHEVNYKLMKIDNKDDFIFVNAHRTDIKVTKEQELLKVVSGCGIAYLTMLISSGKENIRKLEPLLYLVGVSTISDVMPLNNPVNRYFVNTGLNWIYKKWPNLIMNTLQTLKLTTNDLSFYVIPTINTGNRSDREDLSYGYVKDDQDAVKELQSINIDRKVETKRIYKELLELSEEIELENCVVAMLDTSFNLAGNVAAKVGDYFRKPTIIFNKSNSDILTGSFRGIIKGIDGEEVLSKINKKRKDVVASYGGHKMACGCSVYKDKIEVFKELFNKYIGEQLSQLDVDKSLYIDAVVRSNDINYNLYKSTEIIGPYGKDWEAPTFLSKLKIHFILSFGDVSKVLFKTKSGRSFYGFYPVPKSEIEHYIGQSLYVVFNLDMNTKNRVSKLELRVIDIIENIDINILKNIRRLNG